ncbi:hypothetical protein AVEN_271849-1 [Araneus ventricosus]|uniref:Uncharacterized protein n=1 Tax=Araneus ventricosus TaxID=182803 RepID=A0A4Y2UU85_ARAVE|nr:hypothetical protein AVEN_271849-1 [Araneus ventricosus]
MDFRSRSGIKLDFEIISAEFGSRRSPQFSAFFKIKGEVTEDTKEFYSKRYADSIQALTSENNLWRKIAYLRKPFTTITPSKGSMWQCCKRPIEKV